MKSSIFWIIIFCSGCSLGVDPQPSQELQAETSSSSRTLSFKMQLERRLLVELWVYLLSQKETLEQDLLDVELSDEERAAIREVLEEINEQLSLTLTEIGDD